MAEVPDASTERDHTPPPSEPSATASPATVIPLSLTEDYAPAWGVWEGVRELVQNWHDGCLEQTSVAGRIRWESHADDAAGALQRFEAVDADGGRCGTALYDPWLQRLTLVNRDVSLERRVLLLGTSHKAQIWALCSAASSPHEMTQVSSSALHSVPSPQYLARSS